MLESKVVQLWYIRDLNDADYRSVPFKSEAEAAECIADTEEWQAGTHEPYRVITDVTFNPSALEVAARHWVQESYPNVSLDWSQAEYWEFIEEHCLGGRDGFILHNG